MKALILLAVCTSQWILKTKMSIDNRHVIDMCLLMGYTVQKLETCDIDLNGDYVSVISIVDVSNLHNVGTSSMWLRKCHNCPVLFWYKICFWKCSGLPWLYLYFVLTLPKKIFTKNAISSRWDKCLVFNNTRCLRLWFLWLQICLVLFKSNICFCWSTIQHSLQI